MTVMTRKQERLIDRLVAFAGDPVILQEALEVARSTEKAPPELPELLRVILELRDKHGRGRPSREEIGA